MAYKPVQVSGIDQPVGTGWLRPMPDFRDFTEDEPKLIPLMQNMRMKKSRATAGLPAKVDLRKWCSPIENQLDLGSCTAHAAMAIVEYFETRRFGKYINGSRLFVYKATRNLMGVTGDTGAWLRDTMGALALLGVPPEKYWPYKVADFDLEPSSFVYSVADDYEALRYFCHDPQSRNLPPDKVLTSVQRFLAAGVPSMFGFYGFPSFSQSDGSGKIPYPCPGEGAEWGHAVAAVGYDDKMKIKNTDCNETTTGALLIRNSWGTGWGSKGYGWLPYEYVKGGLALDFWSLLRIGWVDTGIFGLD